jgi:signal transduction histidine kinase/DNA-binding response OmpR family regulator
VAHEKNYSMRAVKRSNDELGMLVDTFNGMLAQIQVRDVELREAKDALEQRVEERTRELQSEVIEHRRTEEELLKAKEAAELATRAKSEFLANMSHEIRTPMNGVIGTLGLLHDSELSDRQREFAQIARSSAESLLSIINDILDFSKIEAGKLTIEPVAFDLQAVVEEVGEIFAPKVAEKQLDLIIRYAPESPRQIIADPGRVRQVLTNLVGNAIKFTAAGHVLINVQCEPGTIGPAHLKLSVQDTGIGIPEDKLKHIFEKFTQADASTTRRFGGTGLGLAISKQLVELMGGHFVVASQPGQGSTFWFTLPFSVPDETPTVATHRASLAGVRVLIVDDNEVNRRVLHEQITSWRMRNGGYASGEEALAVLREAHKAGDPYHIAVLDYQMPGMDGEMLARAIKADPVLQETVLVMLTSGGHPNQAKHLKEAGIFACLDKPVRQSKFRDVLAVACGARNTMSATQCLTRSEAPAAKSQRRMSRRTLARVLVADDNTTNQRVARLMLENLGCRVDVAANGKEAIEMLALLPYDVVFMDCEMPELDGYEATAEIRQTHAGAHVRIIAMTAKAIQGDRERCLEAGMDDYISKPVRLEDLEEALERWIPKGRNGVQAEPEEVPGLDQSSPESPALDPEVTERLRSLAAVDPTVLDEIHESFLTGAIRYLEALREAARAGDPDALAKAAHAFKGASGNIGASHTCEICRQLELLGNSRSVAGAGELIQFLEREIERVKIEIEKQTATEPTA